MDASNSSSSSTSNSNSGGNNGGTDGNTGASKVRCESSVITGLPCATGLCLLSKKSAKNGTCLCAWEGLTNELLWTHTVANFVHFWYYSPDASRAVIVEIRLNEFMVTIIDLTHGTTTQFLLGSSDNYKHSIMQVSRVADQTGNRLYVCGKQADTKELETWNLELGVRLIRIPDVGLFMSVIGDGQHVAACTADGIHIWDSDAGNELIHIRTNL
jgi:hypothetical protein